ncbi:MAG: hypothetical protein K2M05_04045, partial [Paramuribaculum sp.]|nr:hypothetical protein [Paramuribaculum sp.]
FGEATEMPEGWTTRYCITSEDGSQIYSDQPTVTLSGLNPYKPEQIYFQTVYISPEGNELWSEKSWSTEDLLPINMPIINISKGNEIFQRSGVESEYEVVYDYILELKHNTSNSLNLPIYLGYEISNSNTLFHDGHETTAPAIRLMTANEAYSSSTTDLSISGNEGVTSDNPHEWARLIGENRRTVLYFTHFHCENPSKKMPLRAPYAGTDYASVTANLHTYVPLLYTEQPVLKGVINTKSAANAKKLTVLKNPATDSPAALSFEIPIDEINKIATFISQPECSSESQAPLYDLHGRQLHQIPTTGFFIQSGSIFRR